MTGSGRALSRSSILIYGSGDIFGGGATAVIGLYFFFFLTENVGLPPLAAGAVFAIGKLIDAVSDPLMGYLSDITRNRCGRRRPYFLIGILPIWISFFLLWLPLQISSIPMLFLYYLSAYVLFSLAYTLVMVPYSALNAELSRHTAPRLRLAGSRMVFTQAGALAAVVVPNWLLDVMDLQGYYIMGAVFATLFALPWLAIYLATFELPYKHNGRQIGFRIYLARFFAIWRNRTARSHMVMHACSYAAIDVLMVLALYFFTYYLGAPQHVYHLALGGLMLGMIALLPVYYALSRRSSMRLLYCLALGLWAAGLVSGYLFLQPGTHSAVIAAICAGIGIGMGGGMLLPWALFPLVVDTDEYFSGENRAGMYAGMLTLVRKTVQGALVMPLTGLTLHAIGYIPLTFPQNTVVALGLQRTFFLIPLCFTVVGIIAGITLPLTRRRTRQLRTALHDIHSGVDRTQLDESIRTSLQALD